jgi:hypothetical protein
MKKYNFAITSLAFLTTIHSTSSFAKPNHLSDRDSVTANSVTSAVSTTNPIHGVISSITTPVILCLVISYDEVSKTMRNFSDCVDGNAKSQLKAIYDPEGYRRAYRVLTELFIQGPLFTAHGVGELTGQLLRLTNVSSEEIMKITGESWNKLTKNEKLENIKQAKAAVNSYFANEGNLQGQIIDKLFAHYGENSAQAAQNFLSNLLSLEEAVLNDKA